MKSLRDVPLKRKLTIIGMLSSGLALLLSSGAFVTHELVTFRETMTADLTAKAAIIGHNGAAALTFDDAESAAATLKSLSTDPHVAGAALYDSDGNLFVSYERPASTQAFLAPPLEPAGHRFEGDKLKLFYEFALAGEHAGTVFIESDLDELHSRMAHYALISVLVLLISSCLAFGLSSRLQRSILQPISALADVMNLVEAEGNYSARVRLLGKDELGKLTEGFNAMLDRIEAQDQALQDARDHLERRVTERTRALQQEISERELAQAQLEKIHGQLIDASRQAGMAEVATNVLHNVGNVLNSVNVSASIVTDEIHQSKVTGLSRLVGLLREHEQNLGEFMGNHPKGKRIPYYLAQLAENVLAERERNLKELDSLRDNIEHIKRIVSMQQGYSKVSTLRERTNLVELMEDALKMNDGSFNRHEIEIVRDYADVPMVDTDKHKILQILVNLIRNAKDSCKAARGDAMRITLRLTRAGEKICVSVIDNGVGISSENMARIFRHGFTTKKDGHGFGLHSSAIAARELGGSLTATSDGEHRGATFTLELPLEEVLQVSGTAADAADAADAAELRSERTRATSVA